MCGRYTLVNTEKVLERFDIELKPNSNITPKSSVPVINQSNKAILMIWCYNPYWAKKPMNLINARSETLHQKPSFRNASRCIFIADGWYEWQRNNTSTMPFYHHKNGNLIFFAGIYNKTSGCAIVTREAHNSIAFIHHRQPILLKEDDFNDWLKGEDIFNSELIREINYYPVHMPFNRFISFLNDNIKFVYKFFK